MIFIAFFIVYVYSINMIRVVSNERGRFGVFILLKYLTLELPLYKGFIENPLHNIYSDKSCVYMYVYVKCLKCKQTVIIFECFFSSHNPDENLE